jgi:glucokinase
MSRLVVAVDIGGTKSAAALVTADGVVTQTLRAPTPGPAGSSAILTTVGGLVSELLVTATARGDEVLAIGVGSAGVIDASTGVVLSATEVLHDWAGTDVKAALSELSGIPTVSVDNDVQAHALGEVWTGAARGRASVLFIGVGTGIGASIILDGRVWHGHRSVGGHFGHLPVPHASGLPCVCGGSGHVEAVAAGPAIVWAYNRRSGADVSSLVQVREAADRGDSLAKRAITTGAAALGCAIGGASNLIDPEIVILGGGVVGAGPLWWEPMEQALRLELLPPLRQIVVLPAALGSSAALVGAAHLAWEALS